MSDSYRLRQPRRIRHSSETGGAWYYINKSTIDVMIRHEGFGTFSARLTKRQLQLALAAMEKFK